MCIVSPLGAPGEFSDEALRCLHHALELLIRCLGRGANLEVTGKDTAEVGRVLRPARYAQVEFDNAAMAVPHQEIGQALLQTRGEFTPPVEGF